MWRPLRHATSKSKSLVQYRFPRCLYATSAPQSAGGSSARKVIITVITLTGVGAGAAVALGKYDSKYRKIIEDTIPYAHYVFETFSDFEKPRNSAAPPVVSETKIKDVTIESSMLKKKVERQKKEEKIVAPITEVNSSDRSPVLLKHDKKESEPASIVKLMNTDDNSFKANLSEQSILMLDESIVSENVIKELLSKLEKSTNEATTAQEAAIDAINMQTKKLYQALESSAETDSDHLWKQADLANTNVITALQIAEEKSSCALILLGKLNAEIKRSKENGLFSKSPILFTGEKTALKLEKVLKEAEAKVVTAQIQSKTAADYKDLVNKAREQFKDELGIVSPKYVHKNNAQPITEEELHLLIAHAHSNIEHLQRELAKQKVTEKQRIDEALLMQKIEDEKSIAARLVVEISHHQMQLEKQFQEQLDSIHDDFETDMRQQLRRQAAAHADHLQDALQVQYQELDRKYSLELENKLLQQKGVFISEISTSLAKLKGIEEYLKAKAYLNEAARKTQALWVACQAMKTAIASGFSEEPKPLGKELAVIKSVAGEESLLVNTFVSGIPLQAVERGIYTDEYLKQKFDKVKQICRRVAMIDENNKSLYRYMLSYIQSFFIVDTPMIPAAELEGKVAVDVSEWDTFSVLNRITYCLQRNDMIRALRYANQLQGEPRNVAMSWISELRLLLETSQAVDCLIAYASAIGVQAYH